MMHKKSDIQRYVMAHYKKIRQTQANPSEETLRMWRWQDIKDEMLLHIYEQEEAAAAAAAAKAAKDDDDTFNITTEVKIK